MRKTKIICTVGPATDQGDALRQLMQNGMDVARLNFSHGTHEDHKVRADKIKQLREELDLPVALLLDTKGPEIRTGTFKEGQVTLKEGASFTLTTKPIVGDETISYVTFSRLPKEVHPNSRILIDDGLIELNVNSCTETEIHCTVVNGGILSSQKGINVPNISLSLPFISEKDQSDIAFGVKEGFDLIAASFTRSAEDILNLRRELKKNNCHNMRIIAKIENMDGVRNIDEILRVSDGIMVARGDLGVEVPLEEIPILQKQLIKKAMQQGKTVITATQMLDSMISHPRPTRAEATDVANAIYDGTSAIMLSGETAAGKFPVEALKTMVCIATRTEEDIDYAAILKKRPICSSKSDVTSAISHATCTTAHDLGAAAIITVSKSGTTARMISKYHPACPIITGTTDPVVRRQLNISWGVTPIIIQEQDNTDALFDHAIKMAQKAGLVKDGDLTVITAGVPLGISGTTNLLKVQLVGDILVSGKTANKGSACGNLCVCSSPEDAKQNFKAGDILVVHETDNQYLPYMRKAFAIVSEAPGLNSHAAIVGLALDTPTIVGAKNATKILRSGTVVTVDADRGIVYCGQKKFA